MSATLSGVAPLAHLGVIRAEGEEAAKFLHAQLTQDFVLMQPGHARLAALCSAKGRMLASFVAAVRAPGDILLVCSRDLLAPTLKRLSMFVLRAKVKLSDASEQFAVYGVAGEALEALAPGHHVPWSQREVAGALLVHLYPVESRPRALCIVPAGQPAPQGAPLTEAQWRWSDVHSGVAMISAPLVEALVPQMLNYESVGGVNFKKGCYPGQEVVARSQFRGTLKRRGYIVHCDAMVSPGAEVFHADDAEQPVGVVVESAPAPHGGWDAIVSMQIAAADGGHLTAGAPDGPALQLLPLPYLLLEDV